MFVEPTVFLLGAGASWHYGYPTGEELVKKIIQKAVCLQPYLEFSARAANQIRPNLVVDAAAPNASIQDQWTSILQSCVGLRASLEQVNPLVIDYFLGWNPKFRSIGRLLIAWVILECEHIQTKSGTNVNRRDALSNSPLEAERMKSRTTDLKKFKDNWCRFVVHQLAIRCKISSDIFENHVRFITFNYDLSLERSLSCGLNHIELFQRTDIEDFLANNRIVHVYGKVREDPFVPPPDLKWAEQARDPKDLREGQLSHLHKYKRFLDVLYAASQGIRVIDPDDRDADNEQKMPLERSMMLLGCTYSGTGLMRTIARA
jgi:hypothetical protein